MFGRKKATAPQQQEKLGLYIHIPFCRSKCDYCDFYSLANREDRMDEYQKALLAHLRETAPLAQDIPVDTVYFGGGTPSFYGEKRLRELLAAIKKEFRVEKDGEITLEANPDSVDLKALLALRRAGFNRLSLGMQSASDAELQAIGRVHTWEQVGASVEAARKAKFENLSLDLIYGLPRQTMEQWQANLTAAVDLAPEADMYLWTVEFLAQMGYTQYEISNFAKPGRESRHNLKYWTLQEYVGFGPGAHSDFGGVRYAYGRDLEGYIQGVQTHAPMLSESESIPPLDRDTEWLMLGLRTVQGLDPKVFERRFRRRFDCFRPFLEECRTAGYAVEEEGLWHLTPKGFLVSNQIIGGMLDALASEKRRRAEATARGDFRVDLGNPGKA